MTNKKSDSLFGLSQEQQEALLRQLSGGITEPEARRRNDAVKIPDEYARFDCLPAYKEIIAHHQVAQNLQMMEPFFQCHDTKAKGRAMINGEEFINFSTYDYLGLNGHPEVNQAACEALEQFGSSAGASRLVAGERPPHRKLEQGLSDALQVEATLTFVSGHATNLSTLQTLLGPKDVIFYDALSHNSIIMGAQFSGAARYSFKHNDMDDLLRVLKGHRTSYERAVIATEGVFSMDGSVANLPELLTLKREFKCFLMMDEAHSFGVLGQRGLGVSEHFGLPAADIDIIMGTLSKTMCGCGGFISGSAALIELLKYKAPGFVYSVGMPPPIAAASAKALEIMLREPNRVRDLRERSGYFLQQAKARGFDTGVAEGFAVVPIITGGSLQACMLSVALFRRKINALPIIYPAVEEKNARLRFFLSAVTTHEDIRRALDILQEEFESIGQSLSSLSGAE